jgi:hypothetical protein
VTGNPRCGRRPIDEHVYTGVQLLTEPFLLSLPSLCGECGTELGVVPVIWAEIVPSELDRFHERGRSLICSFSNIPPFPIPLARN